MGYLWPPLKKKIEKRRRTVSCYIMLKRIKLCYTRRHNQETLQIPFGKCTDIQAKLEEGFLLNEVVAAMRAEILLLVMYLWDSLRYQVCFPKQLFLVNLLVGESANIHVQYCTE